MTRLAALVLVVPFAGCGGGGGGSSIPEVPFTAFTTVRPNTTVVMNGGISTTASGTYVGALSNVSVQNMNAPVTDLNGASTEKLTYDGSKTLSGMSFSTPSGGVAFSRGSGTTFICSSGVCGAETSSALALVIDGTVPAPSAWNYQTFGVWAQLNSATAFQIGALSAGAVTPASAVPATGSAVFTGIANGFFVETVAPPAGTISSTVASMSATANFGAGTIAFSTTGTTQIPLNPSATSFSRPGLDLTGTLVYDPTANRFTGAVAPTPSPSALSLAGTATGRFYGPAAQEIGGTFQLTGSSGTYVGGFGGKQ